MTKAALLTPAALGRFLNPQRSASDVNKILGEMGLQFQDYSYTWRLTDKAYHRYGATSDIVCGSLLRYFPKTILEDEDFKRAQIKIDGQKKPKKSSTHAVKEFHLTFKAPTDSGFYWYWNPKNGIPIVVFVVKEDSGELSAVFGLSILRVNCIQGLWSEPIKSPLSKKIISGDVWRCFPKLYSRKNCSKQNIINEYDNFEYSTNHMEEI